MVTINRISEEGQKYRIKYIRKDQNIFCLNKRNCSKILRTFAKANLFNRPDFYFYENNTVYIFEHFEFDSSPTLKPGGSLNRLEEARTEEEYKLANIKPGEIHNSQIHPNINNSSYMENLFDRFDKHYKKIDSYKKNVCQLLHLNVDNVSFVVTFVIEDTTHFGNAYFDKNGPHQLLPSSSREFLDYLRSKTKVNYIICSSEALGNDERVSVVFGFDDLDELTSKSIIVKSINLVDLNPFIIRGRIL